MIETCLAELRLNNEIFPIVQLNEFGFRTGRSFSTDVLQKTNGVLQLGSFEMPISFRVRDNRGEQAVCSFAGIAIKDKEKIKNFLLSEPRKNPSMENTSKRIADDPVVETTVHRVTELETPSVENAEEIVLVAEPSIHRAIEFDTAFTEIAADTALEAETRRHRAVEFDSAFSETTDDTTLVAETAVHREMESESELISVTDDTTLAAEMSVHGEMESETVPAEVAATIAPTRSKPKPNRVSNLAPIAREVSMPSKNKRNMRRIFAWTMLIFSMIGLTAITLGLLKSRGTLNVSSSILSGNQLPINAKIAGEIKELLVKAGDTVRQGDVLLRLSNPEIALAGEQCRTELEAAKAKVSALQQQRIDFNKKLKIASEKLKLDREVAVAEFQSAEKSANIAQAAVNRMTPYLASGAVSNVEFDSATDKLLAAEANKLAKQNLIRQIEFSQTAAASNLMILGDRMDAELGRIEADLKIAKADLERAKKMVELSQRQMDLLEIVAPRDGKIYATYHHAGQFLRVADETIAIAVPGQTWVCGNVLATQASRVRPGQPAKIKFPTLDLELTGTVVAVGKEALVSQNVNSATISVDTATEVPVKVVFEDLPENVPAGTIMEMTISTGYGIPWLDQSVGR